MVGIWKGTCWRSRAANTTFALWTLAPGALTRMTADLPRYIENPGGCAWPDGIAPAVLYMVSDLSGDQTGKVLGVSGPRGVREMRMMEMAGLETAAYGLEGAGRGRARQGDFLLRGGDQDGRAAGFNGICHSGMREARARNP